MNDIITDSDLAALAAVSARQPSTRPPSLMEVEFEAFMYMLRLGPSVLTWPRVAAYAARLTDDQLRQCIGRLTRRSLSHAEPSKPAQIPCLTHSRKEGQK